MNMMNKRIKYLISAIIIIVTEVFIAFYVHDNFIRPYAGDILVVFVLYFLYKTLFPKKNKNLPIYIFIFSVIVEILQGINIIDILGLGDITFFRILLGTNFDIKDILCYLVGCVILYYIENKNIK
ncbi:hypothetical protein ANASTE_00246 [Anaerofustis stercorihominis DSM 17244]|uniref:DUF2809 domain-containing protein n=2 Tax=Anaerofustis stercorihominis TaxID=214853 RepID=B1C6A6_9FIRM|nr:DUF2809 domain-containing protein [Anaerofustis stercorihominis]EDS73391.1 hypothetical protein ANASTE_00246 [Anaerofustis stercorihominis DSM 17244]